MKIIKIKTENRGWRRTKPRKKQQEILLWWESFSSLSSLSSIYHEALVSHSNRSPKMTCKSILTTWSLWLHVLPNSCPIHLMTRDPEIAFLFDQKRGWKGEYRYFSFKLYSFLYNLTVWERAKMAMCSLMSNTVVRKGMKYIDNSLPCTIHFTPIHNTFFVRNYHSFWGIDMFTTLKISPK